MTTEQEVRVLDEIKELSKGITSILVAVGKLETEMRQVSGLANKVDVTEKLVVRLESDLATAFKRIDALQGQIDDLEDLIEEDKKASKADKKWVWGFAVAAITLAWRLVEYLKQGSA